MGSNDRTVKKLQNIIGHLTEKRRICHHLVSYPVDPSWTRTLLRVYQGIIGIDYLAIAGLGEAALDLVRTAWALTGFLGQTVVMLLRALLHPGRIRFVGDPDRRIREDYLRILRYFRFHAQIGRSDADPTALAACARHAAGIDRLSGERVQTEFMRLLAATDPRPCLELMMGSGVLDRVVGDAVSLVRLKNLLAGPLARPLLRLAALVRPPPAVARTRQQGFRTGLRHHRRSKNLPRGFHAG